MAEQTPQGPQGQKIQIHIDESVADGHYSNLVAINHSPAEFVLDFVRMVPMVPKAKVQTRVLMAPIHAKSLIKALEQNVKKYEEQYGEIKMPGPEGSDKSFGFQS
ncbi:MAG TPA: DUF3467 domain-containing protein [Bacteroidetes bacterium]|nr:DUF3467 domain-containing protein [Bacteroidota bacterium]HEX04635.1 DUF3467 domain-containing protein [Bacteroidota bacterium]